MYVVCRGESQLAGSRRGGNQASQRARKAEVAWQKSDNVREKGKGKRGGIQAIVPELEC